MSESDTLPLTEAQAEEYRDLLTAAERIDQHSERDPNESLWRAVAMLDFVSLGEESSAALDDHIAEHFGGD